MWRLTFCQLDMDAVYFRRRKKILVIRLAKPISNPEIYLDEFQAWLENQTGKLCAKQTASRTIRQVGLLVIKR